MKKLIATFFFVLSLNALAQNRPMAYAGPDQVVMDTDVNGSQMAELNAIGTTDIDNDITSFTWRDASNTVLGTGSSLVVDLGWGGHEITLIVEDAQGLTSQDIVNIYVGDPTNGGNDRIAIRGGSLPIFASGINLAWNDFAKDVVSLNEAFFEEALDDIAEAGGNSLRWWLHTNGLYSPEFHTDGSVIGIRQSTVDNMRKVLDMAFERGIVISMCLFSFDLLQDQGQNMGVMKDFIEDPKIIQSYIDNALIPMLEEIGDHPAVMTWEIFNEAEGMSNEYGWSSEKTSMAAIQRFVNLVAGAIQRNTTETLVSTGVWSMRAMTDVEGFTNYYSDERLIAAGGDQDGVLDFYQIHFYPVHFGNELSPFHRPASYWGLDKPIVIGEFPVRAIDGQADPQYTTAEAFQLAIRYGYAGAMPWNYTGHDGGDISDAVNAMSIISSDYEEDIKIADGTGNSLPAVVTSIDQANIVLGSTTMVEDYVDLSTVFNDPEDGNSLEYSLLSNSNEALCDILINGSQLSIALTEGVTGKSEIRLRATDSGGASNTVRLVVNVRDPQGNLALFKATSASSIDNEGFVNERVPAAATDGDIDTRWSSEYSDFETIMVDFGAATRFTRVNLFWNEAFGNVYDIQVSDNRINWIKVAGETNGNGGEDEHSFDVVEARYVRMEGVSRVTALGFSLQEFEVYNDEVVTSLENEAFAAQTALRIYPNPTTSIVTVQTALPSEVTFYNLSGAKVVQAEVLASREFDLSELPAGVFLIKVVNASGQGIYKIIKN